MNIKEKISGGNSKSFIFTTSDERLIIKTISPKERTMFLQTLLKSYSKRIVSVGESKLARILGAFQVLPSKQDFIIMENIVPFREKALIFDLKGSKINRETLGTNYEFQPGIVYKDVDFLKFSQKILLGVVEREKLLKTLEDDMSILKELNIMDYSILVSFYDDDFSKKIQSRYSIKTLENKFITLGIIDLFQFYNLQKKAERKIKLAIKGSKADISAISTQEYYKRISEFLREAIHEFNNVIISR